jgi:hypothetical protein
VRLPLQLSAARLRVGLVAISLLGCGGPTTPAVMTAPGPTALALGIGQDAYMSLTDGQPAQVVHGPQGGYHIVVALQAHGIWPGTPGIAGSPDDPVTTLRAFRASGTEFGLMTGSPNVLHVAYGAAADGVELPGRLLRLDIRSPSEIAGETLLLHADVLDRDGRTASDQKHVVAVPPAN